MACNVSHVLAGSVRRALEETGALETVSNARTSDGRTYPSRRTPEVAPADTEAGPEDEADEPTIDPAEQFYSGDPEDADPITDEDWELSPDEKAGQERTKQRAKLRDTVAGQRRERREATAYANGRDPHAKRIDAATGQLIRGLHERQKEHPSPYFEVIGDLLEQLATAWKHCKEDASETDSLEDARRPFNSLIRELGLIKTRAEQLANGDPKAAAWLVGHRLSEFTGRIVSAQNTLKAARPHAECPRCKGGGCKTCQGSGFVNWSTLQAAPTDADMAAASNGRRAPEPSPVIRDGGIEI